MRPLVALTLAIGFTLIISSLDARAADLCQVGTTYRTSVGASFECVRHPGFGPAWKAPHGAVWSATQGDFTNSGTYDGSTIVDSDATRACVRVGGELPSRLEAGFLRAYFERDARKLTARGLADYLALFPDAATGDDRYPVRGFWLNSVVERTIVGGTGNVVFKYSVPVIFSVVDEYDQFGGSGYKMIGRCVSP